MSIDTWKGLYAALSADLYKSVGQPWGNAENNEYAHLENIQKSLNGITSWGEYMRNLKAFECPIHVPVHWLRKCLNKDATIPAVDVRQDEKDIKRDSVVVNGVLHRGAIEGYHCIIECILQHLVHKEALSTSNEVLSVVVNSDRREELKSFAAEVLSASNRTESGGDAYDALDLIVKHDEYSLIRPNSDAALPISIELSVGAFVNSDGHWAWGVRALVIATTVYIICDINDPTQTIASFTATNTKILTKGLWGVSSSRRDLGSIQIDRA
jgi:hypothetical protein